MGKPLFRTTCIRYYSSGMITSDSQKQGDVLIVTVIKDKDVRRGPGRPISMKLRAVPSLRRLCLHRG